MATNNAINQPQISFFSYMSGSSLTATGDGTVVYPVFDSTLQNLGAAYNTSTGYFNPPVNGLYLFSCGLDLSAISASHTSAILRLLSGSAPVQVPLAMYLNIGAVRDPLNEYLLQGSVIYYLSAGHSMRIEFIVSGGTKTIDLNGGATRCWFSGNSLWAN